MVAYAEYSIMRRALIIDALRCLHIQDIDIIELNEAFAAQAAACIRELGLDELRVNPRRRVGDDARSQNAPQGRAPCFSHLGRGRRSRTRDFD